MKRRGISPVIAVLLLIVIAVAAAVLTYVWLTGYLTSQFGSVQTTQLGEQLKIEAAKLETNGYYEIYVRNIGDANVFIDTVYLLASDGSVMDTNHGSNEISIKDLDGNPLTTITPGTVAIISGTFSGANDINAGTTYYLKIITSTGTEFTVEVKAVSAS